MSPRVNVAPATRHDSGSAGPWSIISFADGLVDRQPTTTRMGMPFRLSEPDEVIVSIDEVTTAAVNFARQFWASYLSATESGITYASQPRPVREEVQRLRDEVVRRTRLTRQQIARALGVDRRSLSSWVNGAAVPGTERLERLQHLAATAREIDALRPGEATEVLLARRKDGDILDLIARGDFDRARNWQRLPPGQAVAHVGTRQVGSGRQPLYASAVAAYLDGRLSVPPRAHTVREPAEYEQDLQGAEVLFSDDVAEPRRGRYR
jgi:transcriptional regulator with XRE-family HTH domain